MLQGPPNVLVAHFDPSSRRIVGAAHIAGLAGLPTGERVEVERRGHQLRGELGDHRRSAR